MILPTVKPDRKTLLAAALAVAAFFALIVWSGSGTLCYWRTLTGLPCPGCGLTTALFALGHGDWHGAWTANAGVFLLPLLALLIWRRRQWGKFGEWLTLALLTFFIGYFVCRLILFFPDGPYPMVYNPTNVLAKIRTLLQF